MDDISTGDLHSEGAATVSGSGNTLSAAPGERFEYVTTFTDNGNGNAHNEVQVGPVQLPPSYLRSTYCTGAPLFMGVPVTYVNQNLTLKAGSVSSGIFCVNGNIKVQSGATGTVVLLATGTISTSGTGVLLKTADPTGANLLMLSGSADTKAISVGGASASYTSALVAKGGVDITTANSLFDTALIGSQVHIAGTDNTLHITE